MTAFNKSEKHLPTRLRDACSTTNKNQYPQATLTFQTPISILSFCQQPASSRDPKAHRKSFDEVQTRQRRSFSSALSLVVSFIKGILCDRSFGRLYHLRRLSGRYFTYTTHICIDISWTIHSA